MMDTGVPRVAPDGSFAGHIGSCTEITATAGGAGDAENQASLAGEQPADFRSVRPVDWRAGNRAHSDRPDLHDDVSQRIAGLSIMISGLKRRLRGQPAEADVVTTLTSLQQHTIALAEEIRHLSHDSASGPAPACGPRFGVVRVLRRVREAARDSRSPAVRRRHRAPRRGCRAVCVSNYAEALRNVAKMPTHTMSPWRLPHGGRCAAIDRRRREGVSTGRDARKGAGLDWSASRNASACRKDACTSKRILRWHARAGPGFHGHEIPPTHQTLPGSPPQTDQL